MRIKGVRARVCRMIPASTQGSDVKRRPGSVPVTVARAAPQTAGSESGPVLKLFVRHPTYVPIEKAQYAATHVALRQLMGGHTPALLV